MLLLGVGQVTSLTRNTSHQCEDGLALGFRHLHRTLTDERLHLAQHPVVGAKVEEFEGLLKFTVEQVTAIQVLRVRRQSQKTLPLGQQSQRT